MTGKVYLPEYIDGFEELAEYLAIDINSILDTYNNIYKNTPSFMKFKYLSDIEFKKKFPDEKYDPKSLTDYYSKSENLLFELTEYHSTSARRNMSREVIKHLQSFNARNVLDFGCGIADDSINVLKNKIACTLCEIDGKTYDYAKWRIKKRKLKADFINIDKSNSLTNLKENSFDSILCFEVLMHLPNPADTLKIFSKILKKDGYLFLTYRFKQENYNLALNQNLSFEASLNSILLSLNLKIDKKISVWNDKLLSIYKKIC